MVQRGLYGTVPGTLPPLSRRTPAPARLRRAAGAGGAGLRALIYRFQQYLNRLEAVEVPIICAMHGRALGLGIELALACDIRLMSDDCIWAMPELKLGVIADLGGTSRLARLIGPSRTMEIFLTARDYTAQQAADWGLVNYIFPEKHPKIAIT